MIRQILPDRRLPAAELEGGWRHRFVRTEVLHDLPDLLIARLIEVAGCSRVCKAYWAAEITSIGNVDNREYRGALVLRADPTIVGALIHLLGARVAELFSVCLIFLSPFILLIVAPVEVFPFSMVDAGFLDVDLALFLVDLGGYLLQAFRAEAFSILDLHFNAPRRVNLTYRHL